MTALVSVLCPTRERPQMLEASVTGLLGLASDPSAVEILVAADPDDLASVPDGLPDQVTTWVAPQRHGYIHLEEYYNSLAAMATGKWLMIWNDDATMNTPGWDAIIRCSPPGILWSEVCNPVAPPGSPSEFPVLPAAWVRRLGHLSLHHSVDMWWARIGLETGLASYIPVSITHDVAWSRDTFGFPYFDSAEMAEAREADKAIVRELAG